VSALHNFLAAVRQYRDNGDTIERRDIKEGVRMDEIWDTKDGRRRVRRDPPTVEEAVLAAQGLTDELSEQTEIVASLMSISAEEARGAVLRMGQRKDVDRITIAARTGRAGPGAMPRAVVVERRAPRRLIQGHTKRIA
jgi:hypothetical protein